HAAGAGALQSQERAVALLRVFAHALGAAQFGLRGNDLLLLDGQLAAGQAVIELPEQLPGFDAVPLAQPTVRLLLVTNLRLYYLVGGYLVPGLRLGANDQQHAVSLGRHILPGARDRPGLPGRARPDPQDRVQGLDALAPVPIDGLDLAGDGRTD